MYPTQASECSPSLSGEFRRLQLSNFSPSRSQQLSENMADLQIELSTPAL
jgi:hypothetical protein